jgi:hypothetical protein
LLNLFAVSINSFRLVIISPFCTLKFLTIHFVGLSDNFILSAQPAGLDEPVIRELALMYNILAKVEIESNRKNELLEKDEMM